jgi:hypothetical protein
MFWLEVLLNTLGNLLYDLIFPQPVGDATLPPPAYVPPPDVVLPPEGGQCPKQYFIVLKRQSTISGIPTAEYRMTSAQGPLGVPIFRGYHIPGTYTFRLEVTSTRNSFFLADDVTNVVGFNGRYLGRSGQINEFFEANGSRLGVLIYSVRYETVDGSPDDCGSITPPSEVRERLIPVNRPVPIPVPFPPIVTPPVPLPVPIPPAPPVPRNLPRPPRPVRPPSDINLDIDLNFDFSTTINFNFNIDCEAKTGTLPTAPFQALAKLLYAVLFEVRELREVVDRMAKQVDCLAEKFCRESKGIYRLLLGEIGYSKRSFYGFATSINEKFTPVGIQILLPQIQSGAGRRVRKFAPNLYSEQALGYYAFQFESGGFGELGELRFSQCYIPIPERAIAIAFWLEPQAGEGLVYCWYDKTEYAE